jgi:Uma2 family endonuclease
MPIALLPIPSNHSTPPPRVLPVEPRPHRWTIEEYRDLYKTGLFCDCKTMLIQGEVFTTVMPNPPHDTALGNADDVLRIIFANGFHIRSQMGFNIGTHNDPGPDIAVVQGKRSDYATQTPTTAVLIVEVSESTLFFDTTTKAELYATANVPDYWVIDLENRQLLVYRDPVPLPMGLGATAYRTHRVFGPTESVTPLAAPHASVSVGDLLP